MHHGWKYKQWQQTVLKNGDHKCSKCGSEENLTADHIKPHITYPELFYDVSNGRVLCDDCRVREMLNSLARKELMRIK